MRRLVWLSLALVACSTPPKPSELEALEKLRQNTDFETARKQAKALIDEGDKLFAKSNAEWKDGALEDSRRDALMSSIKLKMARALVAEARAKVEAQKSSTDLAKSEEEYARVAKDLASVNEAVALMKKLQDARSQVQETRTQANSEQQRMAEQLSLEQQKSVAQNKLAQAELAIKSAETVNAVTLAAVEYGAAKDSLARASQELRSASYAASVTSSEMAKAKAEQAFTVAKPAWEASEAHKSSKVSDESLASDAASLPGVSVRREKVGDMQRLVVPLRNLFDKKMTTLAPSSGAILDAVAALMKKHPTYPTMIIGHTDSKGKHDELVAISLARAQAVYGALLTRGVDPQRLSVSGHGPDEPLGDNKSLAGRAQNNRVEIAFLFQ